MLLGAGRRRPRPARPGSATSSAREPVEDLRIDFEDGYGTRPDDEEDADAVRRARDELRAARRRGTRRAVHGIRFKSFEAPTRRRGLRTLALFLERLVEGGPLPGRLRGHAAQGHRGRAGRGDGRTPPSGSRPRSGLATARCASRSRSRRRSRSSAPTAPRSWRGWSTPSAGRCTGLHYGTYDYSAFCGIAAAHQSLEHPVADHAKAIMQAAAAGTGVRLSDGSTNVLPVGDADAGRGRLGATTCGSSAARSSAASTRAGTCTRRSCRRGTRRRSRSTARASPAAAARLRDYVERPRVGILDEPATARALADFLLRGPRLRRPDDATRSPTATGLDTTRWPALAHRATEREATMGIVLGANRYGKAETRVVRIVRDTAAPRDPRPQRLDLAARRLRRRAHRRRPVPGAAHRHPEEHRVRLRQEARRRARRRTTRSRSAAGCSRPRPAATGAQVAVEEYAWDRIPVDGAGHDHAFVRRGGEVRTARRPSTRDGPHVLVRAHRTWWC